MIRPGLQLGLLIALALCGGCQTEDTRVQVQAPLGARAVRLVVAPDGDCPSLTDFVDGTAPAAPLYAAEVRAGSALPAFPGLPSARLLFVAMARDAACQVIGYSCVAQQPNGSPLRIEIDSVAPDVAGCPSLQRCDDGLCGSATMDGGRDAGTSDGGADAQLPEADGGPLPPPLSPISPANGATTGMDVRPLQPLFRFRPATNATRIEVAITASCGASSPAAFRACPAAELEASIRGSTTGDAVSLQLAAPLEIDGAGDGLPHGRRYYWSLRACNDAGCSAFSEVRYLDVGRVPGDLDGDGRADFAVGAPRYDALGLAPRMEGIVSVNPGGSTGVPFALGPPAEVIDCFSNFGHPAIAAGGDLNGDGYFDLVISAVGRTADPATNCPADPFDLTGYPGYGSNRSSSGAVIVYFGRPDFFTRTTPRAADYSVIWPEMPQNAQFFGWALASRGDLDADGFADLAIGSDEYSAPCVVMGDGGVVSVDGGAADGGTTSSLPICPEGSSGMIREVGRLTVLFGAADFAADHRRIEVEPYPDLEDHGRFGGGLTAGDYDGDGYVDLAVAQYRAALFGAAGGALEVLAGYRREDGSPWRARGRVVRIPNPWLDVGENSYFGEPITSGDADGDGYEDLVAGAARLASGGSAFLFAGGDGGLEPVPAQTYLPMAGHRYFGTSPLIVDLEGDGEMEIVVFAAGVTPSSGGATGAAYVFHAGSSDPTQVWVGPAPPDEDVTFSGFGWNAAAVRTDPSGPLKLLIGAYGWSDEVVDGTGRPERAGAAFLVDWDGSDFRVASRVRNPWAMHEDVLWFGYVSRLD